VEARYAVLTWPEQAVDTTLFERQTSVLYTGVGVEHGYGYVSELDHGRRELRMRWLVRHEEAGGLPSVITVDDYVSPREKPGVLYHLAEQVLHPSPEDPASPVSMALLGRDRPRFSNGHGPKGALFSDDLDDTLAWVGHLDHSYVAIQGPPGTGKTYSGAHIIHRLIREGRRVGVTAMSHAAIDNLLQATYEVFADHGDLGRLKTLRQGPRPPGGGLDGVRYNPKAVEFESNDFNLVAGRPASLPRGRPDRRRGRPTGPRRRGRRRERGAQPDPAGRSAPAGPGGQGRTPRRLGGQRARARARRTRDHPA
jgi:uncharacterized protein